jgi:hypothetical protein
MHASLSAATTLAVLIALSVHGILLLDAEEQLQAIDLLFLTEQHNSKMFLEWPSALVKLFTSNIVFSMAYLTPWRTQQHMCTPQQCCCL